MGFRPDLPLRKLISGGQTGADWAALDWAISHAFPHGGWCPLGRRAEDGAIDPRFQLAETPTPSYAVRTRWNVRDADATLIFTLGEELSGGSLLTWNVARGWGKPCLHLSAACEEPHAFLLNRFISEHSVADLNVAGPRESSEPGIGRFVTRILDEALLTEDVELSETGGGTGIP